MEKKRSVLVIDDSPTVRRLVELVLSQEGCEVYTAPDGDEGIEIAKKIIPSLILVDFIMPKMNGYKLCKVIRSDPQLKDIPLILITAKGEDVSHTFEETFGILHCFQKPFEPDALVQKTNEILGVPERKQIDERLGAPERRLIDRITAISPDSSVELIESIDKLLRHYFDREFNVLLKNLMVDVLKETEVIRSKELIISGELRRLSVADVLQLIGTLNLSGKLTLVTPDLNSDIYLDRGQIVFATVSKPGYRIFLTDLLLEEQRLNKTEVNAVISDARKQNLPVGRVIVQQGFITDDELMSYLRQLTEDAIFHALSANSGRFYLEDIPLPLNLGDIKFRIPAGAVILDGLRRLDESKLASEIFRSDDIVPLRLITNEEALDNSISLDEKELNIFLSIDGKASLRDIIINSGLDELEVKRICYLLQKIGLLKIKQ